MIMLAESLGRDNNNSLWLYVWVRLSCKSRGISGVEGPPSVHDV